ncbi:MAG: T9SS type A sorting domain-containing protein, partial [Bacteroidetes bacterium]|nr:T9SS type A sorting domain-containing protein [Bacteroidota bacterium]
GALNYSFNVFADVDDRFLITYFADGSVYFTSDLKNWAELIPSTGRNFLSIAYWEHEKSIVLAERGDTGSIWKLDISELLSTDVHSVTKPEISFSSDNNSVTINSKNDDILSFDIIDVLGKQIAVPISSNSNNIKLDISHLTSGLYFFVSYY